MQKGGRLMKALIMLAISMTLLIETYAIEIKDESLRNVVDANRSRLLLLNKDPIQASAPLAIS
jgi:hypothetical protein